MDTGVEGKNRRKTFLTVVIFDISNNKRRYRMNKFLAGYGFRVQRSAYECMLTRTQYEKVVKRIRAIINEDEDLLRIYHFSGEADVVCFGQVGRIKDVELIII